MRRKPLLIVTSGPTREFFDPIRYLSNPSTGKMGYFIALAGVNRGYPVSYICGPGDPEYRQVPGAHNIPVVSTEDMLHAVRGQMKKRAVLVMAAAPADYRPVRRSPIKLKKTESPNLQLTPNPDILQTVGDEARARQLDMVMVGFAAETHNAEQYARDKLEHKKLDIIFLNDLSRADSGFAVDTNQLTVFRRDGSMEHWKTEGKERLGHKIIDEIDHYLNIQYRGDGKP